MKAGRPRKADPNAVLDAALETFWRQGYESTSMADLMAATGLHKGSLYQLFGDKESLFKAALERYMVDLYGIWSEAIAVHTSPSEGLRAAIQTSMSRAADDAGRPRGCMALNTLVEMAPSNDEVTQLLVTGHEKWVGLIKETVMNAVKANETNLSQSVEMTVKLLTTFLSGLAAQSHQGGSLDEAVLLLDQQMKILGFTQV